MTDKPYVSIARMGNCRIWGEYNDLRCGTCFGCGDLVDGERVSESTHRLWERANPRNSWFYSETGDA